MKKGIGILAIILLAATLLSACATPLPMGQIYTGVQFPVAVGDGKTSYTKVGKAHSTSVLGLFAFGDASISKAKANGGITQISYVDYKADNVLGIVGTYTTTVYGD